MFFQLLTIAKLLYFLSPISLILIFLDLNLSRFPSVPNNALHCVNLMGNPQSSSNLTGKHLTIDLSLLRKILSTPGFQDTTCLALFLVSWHSSSAFFASSFSSPWLLNLGEPWVSVLWYLLSYSHSPGDLIKSHGFQYHLCGHDAHICISYLNFSPNLWTSISHYLPDISCWLSK